MRLKSKIESILDTKEMFISQSQLQQHSQLLETNFTI